MPIQIYVGFFSINNYFSITWFVISWICGFKYRTPNTENEVKVSQSCLKLCNPIDYTVHGILQARILEWVAYPFSSRSSWPRYQTKVSCIAGRFFTNWAIREDPRYRRQNVNLYADFWLHEGQCPWPLHCSRVNCTWFCSFYCIFNIW